MEKLLLTLCSHDMQSSILTKLHSVPSALQFVTAALVFRNILKPTCRTAAVNAQSAQLNSRLPCRRSVSGIYNITGLPCRQEWK